MTDRITIEVQDGAFKAYIARPKASRAPDCARRVEFLFRMAPQPGSHASEALPTETGSNG